jgi:hypothetical protein
MRSRRSCYIKSRRGHRRGAVGRSDATPQGSLSTGLLGRIVGAGVPPDVGWGWPHLQPRNGRNRVSERRWDAPGGGKGGRSRGFPQHRPSGPPLATQRHTIGVVARRMIEGLKPRRWRAGGLPPSGSRCTGSLCRGGCPAAPLCGAGRAAVAISLSTMACPARPGGGHKPADSEEAPARPGERCFPRAGVTPTVAAFAPVTAYLSQIQPLSGLERSTTKFDAVPATRRPPSNAMPLYPL